MQETDLEAVNNQRRRRKRIARMKTTIIVVIAGWIILSMLLIVALFIEVHFLNRKISAVSDSVEVRLQEVTSDRESAQEEGESPSEPASEESQVLESGGHEGYEPAVPVASGIEDEDNLAADGDMHQVFLTFEDGPSERTGEILDILAAYDVKATFFVTGQEGEEYEALYKRIVEEGHTLGMHSYSNKYSVLYQSVEDFEADYNRLQEYLYRVTGTYAKYYRFPGGSNNQISNVSMEGFIHFLNAQQIVYYDWNVSSGDATSNAYKADEIVSNVMGDIVKYKTSVVLLHDTEDKTETVNALGTLIEELRAANAVILPIDENTSVIQYVKASSIG